MRVVTIAAGMMLAWSLFGCSTLDHRVPPSLLAHEKLQLDLQRTQEKRKLDVLVQSEKGGGGTTHRQIYEQELVIADFDWRLGDLSWSSYHTRRRNLLADIRSYERKRLERGWTSQLDFDYVDLLVQRERVHLKEIDQETFNRQRDSYRARLAAFAARGARNEASASAQTARTLAEFDAAMREN